MEKTTRITVISCGIVLLIFTLMTISRNYVWSSEELLWKDVVSKSPNKPGPHNNLGKWYMSVGNDPVAFNEFQTASKLGFERWQQDRNFRDLDVLVTAQTNLGFLLFKHNELDNAETALRGALTLLPYHGQASLNLAKVLMAQRRPEEAITVIDDAIIHEREAQGPSFHGQGELLMTKGIALCLAGFQSEANDNFKRAAELDADIPKTLHCQ